MKCTRCRSEHAAGTRFCDQCGARLIAPEAVTPAHLARKVLTVRDGLAGERKHVTVLFADLKGSLELLVDRDPEDARALLDAVLERLMEAVHRFEGTVNQVMGDGIMALFGAPVAHEDHALRACYAALRMHRALGAFAPELRRRYGVDVEIRVGVNSGDVVVRSIGSDLHMDYTAVGQTTHLAARMEQLARPGTILITAATRRLVEAYVRTEALGPMPVKGMAAPVEVYELRGANPVQSRLRANRAREQAPLVGRDTELAELTRILERVRSREGQVVTLVGEPGVGKSRLLWEFTESVQARGCVVLEGIAVAHDAGIPYRPVADLLRSYFNVEEGDDRRAIREKVTLRLLALDPSLGWAVPALLALRNLSEDDPEWRALDPPQRRERIVRAVTEVVLRQSEREPLLLVIDNLHWLDGESLALLDELVPRIADARVGLLLTHRPEYRSSWADRPGCTQIRLTPLPAASAETLLDGLLGTEADLGLLKRLLIERTDGNPFFLEETVRDLVERQVLEGERGRYVLGRALHSIDIPDRVQVVLAARVDRLSEEGKRHLQAAAVIGKDVPAALLQAVMEVPPEEVTRVLTDLEAAEMLQVTSLFPDLSYSFRHGLTHDVVYASLLRDQRRALHERIVTALERRHPDQVSAPVERLARHAVEAELWPKAARHLRVAGTRAVARSANQEAVRFFEEALEALTRLPEDRETLAQAIDLRLDLIPPLLQLGQLDELHARAGEAERLAGELGDEHRLVPAWAQLINYHYLRGEPDAVIDYATRCLTAAEQGHDRALASLARRYLGHSYAAQGEYWRAVRILEDNIEAFEARRDEPASASAVTSYVASCGWLAFALAELGEFDRGEAYAERGRGIAAGSGHPYSEAIAQSLAGLVLIIRGELTSALPLCADAMTICTERHLDVWRPIASSTLGLCLVRSGGKPDGLMLLEDAVRRTDALGVKAYLALWVVHLGEGLLAAGDTEGARVAGERALELAQAHKEQGHEAAALRLLGELAGEDDPTASSEARGRLAAAIDLARRLHMRPLCARAHLDLGRLARRGGDPVEAEEHLAVAISLFAEMKMRFWLERAEPELRALGRLVIVARARPELYSSLRREFARDRDMTVVLDRRHEHNGAGVDGPRPDRRRLAIDKRLREHGLAIVGPA